jgi:hypothetical protein
MLERTYGKKDMFVEAKVEQQIEEINKSRKKPIRTYKQYKKHCKYKRSKETLLEKRLSLHHLLHKSESGKTTLENGALVASLPHSYIHSLPREQEEVINNMLREYKKNFKLRIAKVTTEEITPVQVVELPEIDEEDCIEIEVESMTPEELEKYEAYKKARNERVKAKFKGSER